MDTIDLVNAAIAGDQNAFKDAFSAAISTRVNDALEVKKVELASSLLTPEELSNEIEGIETEVDGSTEPTVDAGVTSDAE